MTFARSLAAALASSIIVADAPAYAKEAAAPIAIPAPPAGKGQIVWFRPGGMGFALGCSVNEGGQKISSLGAGKYFIHVLEPGRHSFTVKSEAKDVLALEVEADETQFASCKIKMGIMVGRPDIRPSTEAEFRASNGLKMVDDEDMGPAPGALNAAAVAAALAAPAPAPAAAAQPDPAPAPASTEPAPAAQ
jgi:hypothetical protein